MDEIMEMSRSQLISHIKAIDELIEKTDRERRAAEDMMCEAMCTLKELREERKQAEVRLNTMPEE